MDNAKQIPATAVKKAPARKRRAAALDKKKARYGWWFIAPFLIGFAVIYLPMIVQSIYFSFVKINPVTGGGYTTTWVGWENYHYALAEDLNFLPNLGSSVVDLIFDIPAIVVFSLFMAIMLNQDMKGRAVFRAIFFIPVIVSTGIIDSLDRATDLAAMQGQISSMGDSAGVGVTGSSSNMGQQIIDLIDVQRFFGNMMVGQDIVTYVVDMVNGVYDIVNRSGVQMLIFLAGLQSISPSIYESAYMEGASSWETFWKITFPMISPMILVNTIYTVIDSFTSSSNTVMSYISSVYNGSNGGNTVRATAMSWIYFLVIIAILAVVAGLLSAYVFYQRRD